MQRLLAFDYIITRNLASDVVQGEQSRTQLPTAASYARSTPHSRHCSMSGLMRYQSSGLLGPASSRAKRSSGSKLLGTPGLALLCITAGYILGCYHAPRIDPYPVDMDAFLPPPPAAAEQHAHSLSTDHHQAAGVEVQPPARESSSVRSEQQQQQQQQAMLTQRLDVFGSDLAHSLLLQQRPPLQPGRSGNSHYTVAPHQVLSWYPRIALFPAFVDNTTVAQIIALATPLLQPSELGAAALTDEQKANQPVRTSMGVFLNRTADPSGLLAAVEDKIAAVTLIPPSHGEDFNVLRYKPGQHYHSHMDTFDAGFIAHMSPAFGQRMATMIVYLSDVEEGGETVFKREGKYGASSSQLDDDDSLTTCESSDFRYKPRAGDALLFYSMNPDRSIDPRALHGACPVRGSSEKWVVTKWLHDKPINGWDSEAETA